MVRDDSGGRRDGARGFWRRFGPGSRAGAEGESRHTPRQRPRGIGSAAPEAGGVGRGRARSAAGVRVWGGSGVFCGTESAEASIHGASCGLGSTEVLVTPRTTGLAMRGFSRTMPEADQVVPEQPWTPVSVLLVAAICAVLLGFVVWLALDLTRLGFAVGFLALLTTLGAWGSYQRRRLAASRPDQSICSFARDFDRRSVDPWVVRAVWEQLQDHSLLTKRGPFPVRAGDRLGKDYGLDADATASTTFGRSWRGARAGPLTLPSETRTTTGSTRSAISFISRATNRYLARCNRKLFCRLRSRDAFLCRDPPRHLAAGGTLRGVSRCPHPEPSQASAERAVPEGPGRPPDIPPSSGSATGGSFVPGSLSSRWSEFNSRTPSWGPVTGVRACSASPSLRR